MLKNAYGLNRGWSEPGFCLNRDFHKIIKIAMIIFNEKILNIFLIL